MLTLLFTVLVLGVVAWVIQQFPMPQPFRAVAWGILAIILIYVLFQFVGSSSLRLP